MHVTQTISRDWVGVGFDIANQLNRYIYWLASWITALTA